MGDEPIKTDNDFGIGANIFGMQAVFPIKIVTRQQAYRTAAWIKLMADSLPDEIPGSSYEEIEQAISNT